ncbi:hypothetical protein PIB30_007397 [Stylosanthes scabra]|uniref:DUF223 domain-containing protein n=1 Tax=Stylosanthes scabra TaxID=79078 RepID=A0ABU6Z4A8_9FABA|nr:hypothetical protein [Stylosanthes scabra]
MSYFNIVPNQGGYRAAEHEFKLTFLNRTTILPITDDAIPRSCLSLYQFADILNMVDDHVYLVDVIGLLASVGEEREYVKEGKIMKMIVKELASKELTIRCALFGEYMDQVNKLLGFDYVEQPVVLVELAKVKFFRGQVGLQNVMHAIRLYFNPNIPEFVEFKKKFFFLP